MIHDGFITVIVWISIVGNLILGLLVGRAKFQTIAHKSLIVHAAVMALWGACLYFFAHPVFLSSETWLRIVYLLVLVMAGVLVHFSLVFPLSQKRNTKLYLVAWGICSVIFAYFILFTKLFLVTVTHTKEGYTQVLGPVYTVFGVVGTLNVFLSLLNYFRSYRRVQGHEKLQLQYLFLGISIFALLVTAMDVILPLLFHTSAYIWASSAAAIFFVGSLSYVILKHRLLDIDVILRKGLVYTLLFAATMTIYTVSIYAMTSLFTISISQLVSSLLIAVTITPLRDFFETVTDKIFFKKHYTFQTAIKELTQILLQHPRLDELLNQILSLITNLLKTEHSVALVRLGEGEYICRTSFGVSDTRISLHRNTSAIIRFFEQVAKDGKMREVTILDRNERIHELLSKGFKQVETEDEPIVHELMGLNMVLALPLFAHQELEGVILLGNKRSEDSYGSQDMEFLEVVSQETAASMENAISFERLKTLDDVKSELISVVSHQLRTPLSVVRWNMELLLSNDFGQLSGEIHEVVDKSYTALSSLNTGLNNLMMALEIEEGHPLKANENISIAELIEQILHNYKRIREQKQITVETAFEFTKGVKVDATKIRIILEILIDNAFRYVGTKGKIRIETKETQTQTGNECLVTIDDSGIGVAQANRDLIFHKFYRGEEAKRISPNGFGLGLFIARAFAELHNGHVWIGNKEGPGAIFYVSIPERE